MSYQEVTIGELREHLGADKLPAVEALIKSIGQSPEDTDEWITWAVEAFPVIQDRAIRRTETANVSLEEREQPVGCPKCLPVIGGLVACRARPAPRLPAHGRPNGLALVVVLASAGATIRQCEQST